MAVFIGDNKNSSAARTALEINWAVRSVIGPALKVQYPTTSYDIQQAVGIDTSSLFVARTGIRGSNDLVWVGRAANYAAKLSAFRYGTYRSFITEDVFNKLSDESKNGGTPRRVMCDKIMWQEMGIAIYGSTFWWEV
jgi:class 3 adenylate cyclase